MNDRFPHRHGDVIDGRVFFLGREDTKWSWGQGTGINAGVMLWQPDRRIFQEMLDEIQDPQHLEHCKGNGPEQDFLSRFWADAPWTHIGVEYNFQLHQMFFALHPDRANTAERAILVQNPSDIKIVHFSGEPTAKPWHRVLDAQWQSYWPDRSKDAKYAGLFADEFLGHWLWVRRDPAVFGHSAGNPKNWDLEGMYLNKSGEIYRRAWKEGDPDEHLVVPEIAARSTVDFLAQVLREWFDTLQALEAELGLDLREHFAALSQGGATTSTRPLTSNENKSKSEGSGNSPIPKARQNSRDFGWRRIGGRNGWWTDCPLSAENVDLDPCNEEDAPLHPVSDVCQNTKASIVCSVLSDNRSVKFVEDGVATWDEQGAELAGIFVKVVGPHAPRHFRLPTSGDADEEKMSGLLDPLDMWVDIVPDGAAVLVALVAVPPRVLAAVLTALAPLGTPTTLPLRECRALASAGRRHSRRGGGRSAVIPVGMGGPPGEPHWSSHASRDVAHASVMVPATML